MNQVIVLAIGFAIAVYFAYRTGGWPQLKLAREMITHTKWEPLGYTRGLHWRNSRLSVVYQAPIFDTPEKLLLTWYENGLPGFLELVPGEGALFRDPGSEIVPAEYGTERILPELLELARNRFSEYWHG